MCIRDSTTTDQKLCKRLIESTAQSTLNASWPKPASESANSADVSGPEKHVWPLARTDSYCLWVLCQPEKNLLSDQGKDLRKLKIYEFDELYIQVLKRAGLERLVKRNIGQKQHLSLIWQTTGPGQGPILFCQVSQCATASQAALSNWLVCWIAGF